MARNWLKTEGLGLGFFTFLGILLAVAILSIATLLALLNNAESQQNPFIRPSCSLIHVIRIWDGPLQFDQDTTYIGQMHIYLHERYEFVIEIRPMIPTWPDALLCTIAPISGFDSTKTL